MTTLLRTEGIMKAYGGVQALNGATMAVEEGTVAGLIGPNGSGKTTLFNIITGYERPDAGDVWFDGHAITGYCRSCQRYFRAPMPVLIGLRGADSPVVGMRPLACAGCDGRETEIRITATSEGDG